MGTIRIGTSGWSYREWDDSFYPERMSADRKLAFLAERLGTVEINRTFYSLASPKSFRRWREVMPAAGILAVKGSRFITHNKKLSDVDTALANFFASGILDLGTKLGPILWQLPGNVAMPLERIDSFLGRLPRDTESAARLASGHDERVREPSIPPGDAQRIRHVLEIRHPDHFTSELVAVVRRHGVALAFSHSSAWPYTEEVTAGFVYVRLHGPTSLYTSAYGEERLHRWAKRIRAWQEGGEPADAVRISERTPPVRKERDVYVYFDNDGGGNAPREAIRLTEILS